MQRGAAHRRTRSMALALVVVLGGPLGARGRADAGTATADAVVTTEIDLGAPVQAATALHLPAGLLIAGVAGGHPFLARTLANGELDPAFAAGGPTPGISVDLRPAVAWDPAAKPDLSIVYDGADRIVVTSVVGVAAYDADGVPDATFATTAPVGSPVGVMPLDLDPLGFDSSLLVVGRTPSGVGAVRLTPDGSIDTTYSSAIVELDVPGGPVTWVSHPAVSSRGFSVAVSTTIDGAPTAGLLTLGATPATPEVFTPLAGFDGTTAPQYAASGSFEIVAGSSPATGRCIVWPSRGPGLEERAAPGDCERTHRVTITQPVRSTSAIEYVAAESASGVVVTSSGPSWGPVPWLVPNSARSALLDLLPPPSGGPGPATVLLANDTQIVIVTDGEGEVPELEPVRSARLLDTRTGVVAGTTGPRPAGTTLSLFPRNANGVPGDATAVILNVAAVFPDGPGYVTVYPCNQQRPTASNLNYGRGDVVANTVYAVLDFTGGSVCVYTSARTDLVVDLDGYSRRPDPMPSPARLLETRTGLPTIDGQAQGIGPRAAGSRTMLQVTGRAGVPSGASTAILTVTAVAPSSPGYVTVFPCNGPQPVASNLNVGTGNVVANLVYAKLDPNGTVCIVTSSQTDLIVDIDGFLGRADAIEPRRLVETRVGEDFTTYDRQQAGIGRLAAGSTTVVPVAGRLGIPGDTVGAVLNVAVVGPAADGYLTVYPCDEERPVASNLNYRAGDVVANAVVVRANAVVVRADADVCIFTLAATDLIVDLDGLLPAARVPV